MRDTTTTAFVAGRDLAVALLHEREALDHDREDRATIEAKYRKGAPQHNWILAYVQQVIARPELAAGFSAVLSDFMACPSPDAAVYERLTIKQMLGAAPHGTKDCGHA